MPKPKNEIVVLITGASNGIGLAAAEHLAKEGYMVIATARSPKLPLDLTMLGKSAKKPLFGEEQTQEHFQISKL